MKQITVTITFNIPDEDTEADSLVAELHDLLDGSGERFDWFEVDDVEPS